MFLRLAYQIVINRPIYLLALLWVSISQSVLAVDTHLALEITKVSSSFGGDEDVQAFTETERVHGGKVFSVVTFEEGEACASDPKAILKDVDGEEIGKATENDDLRDRGFSGGYPTITRTWDLEVDESFLGDEIVFRYDNEAFPCNKSNTRAVYIYIKYAPQDEIAPEVKILKPIDTETTHTYHSNQPKVTFEGSVNDTISGVASVKWETSNGETTADQGDATLDEEKKWKATDVPISQAKCGNTRFTVTAYDERDNSASDYVDIVYDAEAPSLQITAPTTEESFLTSSSKIVLSGPTEDDCHVAPPTWRNKANQKSGDATLTRAKDSKTKATWKAKIKLTAGANEIVITGRDKTGNTVKDTIYVTFEKPLARFEMRDANNSTVIDSVGAVNGTNHGASLHPDGYLSFDYSDFLEIPSLFDNRQTITLTAWVNLAKRDSMGSEVISLGDYVGLRLDGSKGSGGFYFDGTNWKATGGPALLAGTGWNYLAYVIDSVNHRQGIYVNGILKASSSNRQPIVYQGLGSKTYIGRHGRGFDTVDFNGLMAEVNIYDVALSASSIEALYRGSAAEIARGSPRYDTPRIVSLTPQSGPLGQSNEVVIKGEKFGVYGDQVTVFFGGISADSCVVSSSGMEITCQTPSFDRVGPVDVSVEVCRNGDRECAVAESINGFTVTPATVVQNGPLVKIGATHTRVESGNQVTISWYSIGADHCSFFVQPQASNDTDLSFTTLPPSATRGSYLTAAVRNGDRIYSVECSNSKGRTRTSVEVKLGALAEGSLRMELDSTSIQINKGSSTTLYWMGENSFGLKCKLFSDFDETVGKYYGVASGVIPTLVSWFGEVATQGGHVNTAVESMNSYGFQTGSLQQDTTYVLSCTSFSYLIRHKEIKIQVR